MRGGGDSSSSKSKDRLFRQTDLVLTVQPRSNGDQDDGDAPVPQQRAQPWSVAVPDLLEGQLVRDRIFNDQDVRLLQNLPHTGPIAVQQVLETQIKGQRRRDGTDTSSVLPLTTFLGCKDLRVAEGILPPEPMRLN